MLLADVRTTRRIGAVTLALLAAAVGFAVFVWDRIEWRRMVRVHVLMGTAGGLREGAPLVVAGREIGAIESIALVGTRDGGVDITVALSAQEAARVPRGGELFVASKGPLGARYLELGAAPAPATGANAAGATLADGDRIVGHDPPSLDRVLQRMWDDLTVAREFAAAVRPEAEALVAAVGDLAATLDTVAPDATATLALRVELLQLVAEAAAVRERGLDGDAGLARMADVLAQAARTLALTERMLGTLSGEADALAANAAAARATIAARSPQLVVDLDQTIARVQAARAALGPLLAKVVELRGRFQRGEGSLGRLMTDPEFPEDAKALGKILKRHPWRALVPTGN